MKRDGFKWFALAGLLILVFCILTLCHPVLRKTFLLSENDEGDSFQGESSTPPRSALWLGGPDEAISFVFKRYYENDVRDGHNNQVLNRRLGYKGDAYSFYTLWCLNRSDSPYSLDFTRDSFSIKWQSGNALQEEAGKPLHHLLRGRICSTWARKMVVALSGDSDLAVVPPRSFRRLVLAFSGTVNTEEIISVSAILGEKTYPINKKYFRSDEVELFNQNPALLTLVRPELNRGGE